MSSLSTPSRPQRRTTDSSSSSSSSTSAFTPGGAVPIGYSYLGRSPSLVTPTRKGEHGRAGQNGGSAGGIDGLPRPRFPTSLSHSEFLRNDSKPEAQLTRSKTISTDLAMPRPRTNKPSAPAHYRTSAMYDPQPLSLPADPKTWSSSHVSQYLSHILALVPAPVMETLHEFVASEGINGKAFLRLREVDLAQKGMNTRWRKLMAEASRRLRRDALRRRIWGEAEDIDEEERGEDAALTPSQRRIMTATLKRIRDRKQVQGLIAALESPSSKTADLPEVEHSPSRGTRSGFVQRQMTSFEDLASVAASEPAYKRRTNNTSDESVSSQGHTHSPSLSSSSTTSSLYSDDLTTPVEELPSMDFNVDTHDAWQPLEQDLVDSILCASSDAESVVSEDDYRTEDSATPASSIETQTADTCVDADEDEDTDAETLRLGKSTDSKVDEVEFKAPHVGSIFAETAASPSTFVEPASTSSTLTEPTTAVPHVSSIFADEAPASVFSAESLPQPAEPTWPPLNKRTLSKGSTLGPFSMRTTKGRKGGKELLALFEQASSGAEVESTDNVDLAVDVYTQDTSALSRQTSYLSISRTEAQRILSAMSGTGDDQDVDFALEENRAVSKEDVNDSKHNTWLSTILSRLDSVSMSYVIGFGAGIGFVVVSEVLRGGR